MHAVPQSGETTTAGTVNLHPQAGDDWKTWPDAKQVRAQLGINPPQLSMYLRRGYIVQYKCPGPGEPLRFHPGEVEMLRLRIEQGNLADVQDLRESNVELKDVFRMVCSTVKMQNEHIQALFGLITAPIAAGTGFLTECNRTLSNRVTTMEQSFDQSIATREQLLSLQHERDLSALKAQNRQENIRHGIDRVADALGPMAQQVMANMGLGKKHPGMELLESLDPQLMQVLYATAPLSDFQKQKIREIWPDLQWPDAAPAEAAAPEPAPPPDPPAPPAPAAPEPAPAPAPPSSKPGPPPSTAPSRAQPPPRRPRRRRPSTKEN